MTIATTDTPAAIDGLARALGARRSRRGVLAILAAAAAGTAGVAAVRAADGCGCADGEICLDGICSVIVEDSCEALGCPKGHRCERGACVRAPRRKKVRSGR